MDRQHRPPLTPEHRMAIGATKIGISPEEYRGHRERGEKWCFGCQSWKPLDGFARRESATDGLNNECRDCVNPRAREYARAYYQRKVAARRAS